MLINLLLPVLNSSALSVVQSGLGVNRIKEFLPQILTAAIPSIRVVSVSTNLQDVDAEVSFDV
jgi:hypothetical protein